jgi:trimeric autotransporter adhesin
MSTKTTFKRVALVAVASLGFGVLTSVAPASAAAAAVTYDTYVTVAAGTATVPTITTSITAPAATEDGTVVLDFGPSVATMTYQKPAAKTLSVADSVNSVLSATAGTNKFTAKVVDQYGTAVANHSVSVSVSGRNTVAAKTLGLTDANGLVSFSITDAGTTGTRDTVTFTATVSAGGTGSAVAYVNYGTVTVDNCSGFWWILKGLKQLLVQL